MWSDAGVVVVEEVRGSGVLCICSGGGGGMGAVAGYTGGRGGGGMGSVAVYIEEGPPVSFSARTCDVPCSSECAGAILFGSMCTCRLSRGKARPRERRLVDTRAHTRTHSHRPVPHLPPKFILFLIPSNLASNMRQG